jgi:hypothetical protein
VGGGVERTYRRGYPIEKLAEAMARIRYAGLEFSHA